MKRSLSKACAAIAAIWMIAGAALTYHYFSSRAGLGEGIKDTVALFASVLLAPVLHEFGHMFFAKMQNMQVTYAKFFCFKIYRKQGGLRFGFASPFAADETQSIPKSGGNMQKRAARYTLGGLIFVGVFLAVVLAAAIVLGCFGRVEAALWGLVPYTAYSFILNALPCDYPAGKTDMLVYIGIKKGYPAEKNMLAAMEIQGRLYEGKSFSEVEESLYTDVPQLAEDEPLFAVMLDLKYRYYLEKEDLEKAAQCLNRLAGIQEYLPVEKAREIAAELVYLHSLRRDRERAEECGQYCKTYLQGETATAKRILAAFSAAFGKAEEAEILKSQAEALLGQEPIKGLAEFERILLSRIPSA